MNRLYGIATVASVVGLLGLTSCSSSGWQEISPPGSDASFSLPKPVSHRRDAVHEVYESKQDKFQIQVGLYPRDPSQSVSDAELLKGFEDTILQQVQNNLIDSGYSPTLKFIGDLAVKDGVGQEYRIKIGDQFIFNQFYVTPRYCYCIKIDNADTTNPIVAKFLESFTPWQ